MTTEGGLGCGNSTMPAFAASEPSWKQRDPLPMEGALKPWAGAPPSFTKEEVLLTTIAECPHVLLCIGEGVTSPGYRERLGHGGSSRQWRWSPNPIVLGRELPWSHRETWVMERGTVFPPHTLEREPTGQGGWALVFMYWGRSSHRHQGNPGPWRVGPHN